MSEIRKYQMALRHRTNPRYLTRDFIVPLYTGTEPDPETEVQPDMVVPPQDILPKGAEPVMPSAPEIPNPQDRILELAGGGRVERERFTPGGSANIQKLSNEKYKFVSRRGGGQTSKTFDTMEEAIKFRDSYNEKYPKEKDISQTILPCISGELEGVPALALGTSYDGTISPQDYLNTLQNTHVVIIHVTDRMLEQLMTTPKQKINGIFVIHPQNIPFDSKVEINKLLINTL
jgi:hypothetical protein